MLAYAYNYYQDKERGDEMNETVYVKTWFLKKIEVEKHCQIASFVGTVLKETEKAVFVRFDVLFA